MLGPQHVDTLEVKKLLTDGKFHAGEAADARAVGGCAGLASKPELNGRQVSISMSGFDPTACACSVLD